MKCPNCDAPLEAEFVDIGVGEQQCTPYRCTNPECGWVEPEGPEIKTEEEDLW